MTGKFDTTGEVRIRFSLAGVVLMVTLCGVVFAILRILGPLAAMMTTLLFCAIAAHIAASYLGHCLGINRRRHGPASSDDPSDGEGPTRPVPPKSAPRTGPNLAERSTLAPWQIRTAAQVSLLGAMSGGGSCARLPSEEFNYVVLAVGMLSGAAFGGMASLLLMNFFQHAWRSIRLAATSA